MELTQYVERVRRDLAAAAESGGDDARALAGRLIAPLDSTLHLTLLEALSAAADEITREMAPGSVELRLRGGEPSFVVTPAPLQEPAQEEPALAAGAEEGATARINLRLPEQLKAGVEQAASREGLSVNAWAGRALAAALARSDQPTASPPRGGRIGQSFKGWVS